MARVKRAVNAHKKRRVVLERASGYRGQRSRLYRKAKEQVLHSMTYAYRDRKDRKGDFRRLWIQRINAAARADGITYNRFIQGLRLADVEVDRRMLAELAVSDPAAFSALVDVAKAALAEAAQDRPTPRRPDAPWPGSKRPAPDAADPRRMMLPAGAELTSIRSPRVKAARQLAKRALRQRARQFLAEGPQAVGEALAAGGVVTQLFVTAAAQARYASLIGLAAGQGADVHAVSGEVMTELAQTITPQGVLAVCDFIDVPLDQLTDGVFPGEAGRADGVFPPSRAPARRVPGVAPPGQYWRSSWPACGTRATPAPSCVPLTRQVRAGSSSPGHRWIRTTASASARRPEACSIFR